MKDRALQNALLLIASGRARDKKKIEAVAMNPVKRRKLIKLAQQNGIGVGVDPDNVDKWLELLFKYLERILALIGKL